MRYTVFLLFLAGCATATTPGEVMRAGARSDYKSTRPPVQAAACLEHNAAEIKWGLLGIPRSARTRPSKTPGVHEVVYGGDGAVLAIAEVRPDNAGSSFTIWRSPELGELEPAGDGSMQEQMSRGC